MIVTQAQIIELKERLRQAMLRSEIFWYLDTKKCRRH
jgi:hypothetical protein